MNATMLLVDWPDPAVPRGLLKAGLKVFGYSPDRYSQARIVYAPPADPGADRMFPPRNENETGYLVFNPVPGPPTAVDVVGVYRPSEETPEILAQHALPLQASVIWFQRPVRSAAERALVRKHNLILAEGSEIGVVTDALSKIK